MQNVFQSSASSGIPSSLGTWGPYVFGTCTMTVTVAGFKVSGSNGGFSDRLSTKTPILLLPPGKWGGLSTAGQGAVAHGVGHQEHSGVHISELGSEKYPPVDVGEK